VVSTTSGSIAPRGAPDVRRPSGTAALDSTGALSAASVMMGLVGLGFMVEGGRGSAGKDRAGSLGAVVD